MKLTDKNRNEIIDNLLQAERKLALQAQKIAALRKEIRIVVEAVYYGNATAKTIEHAKLINQKS